MKNIIKRLFFIIFSLYSLTHVWAYKDTTINVTDFIYNNNFDSGLSGWYAETTQGLTDVTTLTVYGKSVVALRSFYKSTTVSAKAAIQLYEGTGTGANYHPIDFSTTTPHIVHDSLIIKVWAMGTPVTGTVSGGTVSGTFTILLQSAVALPPSTPPSGTYDFRVYQIEGFQAISSDSVFGIMTTWNVFTFTFTPPGYCDWWQIRNLEISYTAAPNQLMPTGMTIDRIEMYAIRIDDQ